MVVPLNTTSRFNDWIAARISEYDFVENQDFVNFTENPVKIQRGRPSQEYCITLDMAKELSMVENNDKGKEARRYFIEVGKDFSTWIKNRLDTLGSIKGQDYLILKGESLLPQTGEQTRLFNVD